MTIVQTGNAIDVVIEYDDNGKSVITGLRPHKGGRFFSLPDPQGFVDVLVRIIEEGK